MFDDERLTNRTLDSPETAGYQHLFNSFNVLFGRFLLYIYKRAICEKLTYGLNEISIKMYAILLQGISKRNDTLQNVRR